MQDLREFQEFLKENGTRKLENNERKKRFMNLSEKQELIEGKRHQEAREWLESTRAIVKAIELKEWYDNAHTGNELENVVSLYGCKKNDQKAA